MALHSPLITTSLLPTTRRPMLRRVASRREPLRCCLPDRVQPDRAAFIPVEVDLRASAVLFELECLISGGDDALAAHF